MRRRKVSVRITLTIGIMLAVMISVMFSITIQSVVKIEKEKAAHEMEVISRDRASLVETYIKGCESFLNDYSVSNTLKDALMNPSDANAILNAKEYTDTFSKGQPYLTDLFLCDWDSNIVARMPSKTQTGMVYDDENALYQLHYSLFTHTNAFYASVAIAPSKDTNTFFFSKKIVDNTGEPIGFVGASFSILELKWKLDSLLTEDSMGYIMVDLGRSVYIYDSFNEALIGRSVTYEPTLGALSFFLSNESESFYNYENSFAGSDYLSTTYYMKNNKWLFIVYDEMDSIFADIYKMRGRMIPIAFAAYALLIIIAMILIRRFLRPIDRIENTIEKLDQGEYDAESALEGVSSRTDEFGSIARVVLKLSQNMADQNELYAEMLKAQGNGLLSINYKTKEIVIMNNSAKSLFGLSEETEPEKLEEIYKVLDSCHVGNSEEFIGVLEDIYDSDDNEDFEYKRIVDDGEDTYILIKSQKFTLYTGRDVLMLSMIDITEKKNKESELTTLSQMDALTGIYNRRRGIELVNSYTASGSRGMFCLFDINKFKIVNDTYGHQAGDDVLAEVANVMKRMFRTADILIRLGGDEFVVFLAGVYEKDIGTRIIDRFFDALDKMQVESVGDHKVTASLGAVICGQDDTFEQVYEIADAIMYECKKKGGFAYEIEETSE